MTQIPAELIRAELAAICADIAAGEAAIPRIDEDIQQLTEARALMARRLDTAHGARQALEQLLARVASATEKILSADEEADRAL
ncbi:MAG TPA: hypothetical protein VFS21_33275 [Roseiflexaceae bacterium]|nr:hypothetical protein [Roseiflexaceae bacterium]